ncbi:MAG: sporulation integral membrane protein YtvI [Clostridia bacterium]
MLETERKRKTIINIVYFAIIVAIGLFAMQYAMGVCFPFVFAFLIATLLQRPKNFLVKKTFLKQGSASALCVLSLIIIVITSMALVGIRLIQEFSSFLDYVVLQLQNIDDLVNTLESSLYSIINSLPEFAIDPLKEMTTNLFVQVREYLAGESNNLVDQVTSGLSGSFSFSWITTPLNGVISTAAAIPTFLVSVIIALVSCCFMTADYDSITKFFMAQFSPSRREDILRGKQILKTSLAKIGKAYLLIIGITFLEMSIGLSVISLFGVFSSSYIFVISAIAAVVDIIPVLGTGTILGPWAIYSLIVGDTGLGIGLIVLYATITVIRQILEPKLVAGQLGLSPILTIGAMYFGVKILGVTGIFVAPILIIMLKLLNDEGIIKLWKRSSALEETQEESDVKVEQSSEGEPQTSVKDEKQKLESKSENLK